MSLVMNTAIGTWNGGKSALDGKHWPANFYIDYVRVWQARRLRDTPLRSFPYTRPP